MTTNKPLWFLDIDGVINAWQAYPKIWSNWNNALVADVDLAGNPQQFPFVWAQEVVDFINSVADDVDVLVLSSWSEKFATALSPVLGLPAFPNAMELAGVSLADAQYTSEVMRLKMRTVLSLVAHKDAPYKGRPVVWTDDDFRKSARREVTTVLADWGSDCLFISPHESVGLRPEEVEKIAGFFAKHKS